MEFLTILKNNHPLQIFVTILTELSRLVTNSPRLIGELVEQKRFDQAFPILNTTLSPAITLGRNNSISIIRIILIPKKISRIVIIRLN